MDKELHILILEDNPADAELEEYELRRSGLAFISRVVDTREAFLKELDEFAPDLILADYDLPTFDGLKALEIVKEKCPDVPFILVTGRVGEEFAIETLKKGVTDYVMKGNLKRLVSSINRALEEARLKEERKLAEDARFKAMALFSGFAEASQYGMGMADLDGTILYANSTLVRMLGETSVADCLGKHFPSAYYPTSISHKLTGEVMPAVMQDGHWHGELELRTVNGRHLPTDENYFIIRDEHGRPKYIADILTDITERKRAEQELKQSQEKYSIMVNSSPNAVLIHKNGIIHFINEFGLRITGYHKDEVMGKSMFEFLSDDSKELAMKNIQRRISGEHVERYELKVITKSRDIKYFLIDSAIIPYEKEPAFLVVLSDITDRKRVEESLRDSETSVRTLLNIPMAAAFLLDRNGVCLEANETFAKRLGKQVSDIVGRIIWDFFPSDVSARRKAHFEGILADKKQVRYEDERQGMWNDSVISPVLDEQGEVTKVAVFGLDITERKRAEEEIKMLSSVVEQSKEGMATAGLDGTLTFVNDAWCKMHGYRSSEELLGKNLAIFHNKEQIGNEVKPFNEKVIAFGTYSGEVGHVTRDGKPFPTLMVTTLLKDKIGKPYALAGIAKDITEHKKAEKENQKRVKQLEDFHNIAVDRELRIMKLNKQMEEMKIKLKQYEKT
jgi:PAS domain S-box-containing protein